MRANYIEIPASNQKNRTPIKRYFTRMLTLDTASQKTEVLKASLIGMAYYAAVAIYSKQDKTTKTKCEIVELTQCQYMVKDGKGYFAVKYKSYSEDCNPKCYSCPETVLSLLSTPETSSASAWRLGCSLSKGLKKERNASLKRLNRFQFLTKAPIGALIEVSLPTGTYVLKRAAYFNTQVWAHRDGEFANQIVPISSIPSTYKILYSGAKRKEG